MLPPSEPRSPAKGPENSREPSAEITDPYAEKARSIFGAKIVRVEAAARPKPRVGAVRRAENMFKGISNLTWILKEAQQIQGRAQEMQAKLGQLRVEGRAGGEHGVVQAGGCSGNCGSRSSRHCSTMRDVEMFEDLLISATNQALDKSRELTAERDGEDTAQLQLPGLSEMMAKFGMGDGNPMERGRVRSAELDQLNGVG